MSSVFASAPITAGLVETPNTHGAYSTDFWTLDGGSYLIDFVPKKHEALP